MDTYPIILDGSKFNWFAGTTACDGIGFVKHHDGFPTSGRPPARVAVRSHRTGKVVVFDFVELAEDGETQTLNYEGHLPDGRYCALTLSAD
jgi:hypothetical protein